MSRIMREETPEIIQECLKVTTAEAEAALACAKKALSPDTHAVLDKIANRKGMSDGDLCGVNPLSMFVLVWNCAKTDVRAIEDVLRDIGLTCLQGDTHRLYSILIAMRRSY